MREAVILEAGRTAGVKFGGSLKPWNADRLAAEVM